MLGLRSSPNLDTGVSLALLIMGQELSLPSQTVIPRDNIMDHTGFSERLACAMSAQVFSCNPEYGFNNEILHTIDQKGEQDKPQVMVVNFQNLIIPMLCCNLSM